MSEALVSEQPSITWRVIMTSIILAIGIFGAGVSLGFSLGVDMTEPAIKVWVSRMNFTWDVAFFVLMLIWVTYLIGIKRRNS